MDVPLQRQEDDVATSTVFVHKQVSEPGAASRPCAMTCSAVASASCVRAGAFCRRRGGRERRVAIRAEGSEGDGRSDEGGPSLADSKKFQNRFSSSWNAKDADSILDNDYLYELGRQSTNTNTNVGARAGMIDPKFVGNFLGADGDIASGELRWNETRTLEHLHGDYYICPAFEERIALHLTKNYLAEQLACRVPLILAVWGGKGQGKSFQLELICKKLGVVPIIMSAGELENEWAGTPGKLIRERYRKAAEVVKNQGKMSCLIINDFDAGMIRFKNTQVTVNNQMVLGTLMNICDHPNQVSITSRWIEGDYCKRIPIILTGNDFNRVYAPLVRDGRMDKFYWKPSREDLLSIIWQIFRDDGYSMADMSVLLDTFPNQSLDFYGALRSHVYDSQILEWVKTELILDEDADVHIEFGRRLMNKDTPLPQFSMPEASIDELLGIGRQLVAEQEHVMSNKLSEEYMKKTECDGSLVGFAT